MHPHQNNELKKITFFPTYYSSCSLHLFVLLFGLLLCAVRHQCVSELCMLHTVFLGLAEFPLVIQTILKHYAHNLGEVNSGKKVWKVWESFCFV